MLSAPQVLEVVVVHMHDVGLHRSRVAVVGRCRGVVALSRLSHLMVVVPRVIALVSVIVGSPVVRLAAVVSLIPVVSLAAVVTLVPIVGLAAVVTLVPIVGLVGRRIRRHSGG